MVTNKKTQTKKETSTTKKVAPKKETKKTLGRGLDLLYSGNLLATIDEINNATTTELKAKGIVVSDLKIELLESNPYQPRQVFDEDQLEELATSIRENGVFSPIIVKATEGNKYYIVAGERRVRASLLAGKNSIPAIISDLDNQAMQTITLIENMQREDLNPIEEAYAIDHLMELQKLTQDQVSKVIGKSRSYVANSVRILNANQKLINAVLTGEISYGHARPLIGLGKNYTNKMIIKINNDTLSVREVENFVRVYKLRLARANKKAVKQVKNEDLVYVEDLIRAKLKTKVELTKNRIIIKYRGKDQLNRILERLDALEK